LRCAIAPAFAKPAWRTKQGRCLNAKPATLPPLWLFGNAADLFQSASSLPLMRPRIATLRRLTSSHEIRAYERENRKPETGGSPAHKPGFTFSASRERWPRPANRLHTAPRALKPQKRRSPDGGDGASSVPRWEQGDGREAVTCVLHSTRGVENNPSNHEHFVMSLRKSAGRCG
jgi:hypothetical protein